MTTRADAMAALRAVVGGEVEALVTVADHDAVRDASSGQQPLVLGASAVIAVLRAYRSRVITTHDAQRWAFYVRQGFLPDAELPIRPVDIEFDAASDEVIAEATMRLEELGDQVDGELTASEADALIAALER